MKLNQTDPDGRLPLGMTLSRLGTAAAFALALLASGCGDGSTPLDVAAATSTPASTPAPLPSPSPTPTPAPTSASSPTPVVASRSLACTVADTVRRADSFTIVPSTAPVVIVAIGSSSTQGAYASSAAATYPAVMQSVLATHLDVATYSVVNKGVGGDTLAGTQARLQSDALDLHPQLVILQAGTNDAIATPTDDGAAAYLDRLRAVVAQIKAVTPVVLMNSQHYPGEPAALARYVEAMETVSREQNVPIFDRYALMKSWIDTGTYKFSDVLAIDSFHPNDFTYRCMGQVMAELALARTKR